MESQSVQPPKMISRSMVVINVAFFACVFVFVGCSDESPDLGRVSGRVLRKGEPLAGVTVVFDNVGKGVSIRTTTDPDGRYDVRTANGSGLPPGEYRVAVQPKAKPGPKRAMPGPAKPEMSATSEVVPTKYRKVSTSGLTISVASGDNPPFDFNLP